MFDNTDKWTAPRIHLLSELWASGRTASECAALLGGITRNAVLSKIHRLGIQARGSQVGLRSKGEDNRPKTPMQRFLTRPLSPIMHVKRVPLILCAIERDVGGFPLLDLNDKQCRWEIADPADARDYKFCGKAKHPGHKSYCSEHACKAHRDLPRRRLAA